ncbi:MAG TPA: ABC transporter substrate-binding protein [Hyphomicrobiaceae bacterium]|jgi:iron(III) transport system substrate-binding protein
MQRLSRILVLAVGCLSAISLGPSHSKASDVDVAAAKKEGKVVWYTSTPIETAQKIARLFEGKTGIRVEMFRSGGSAILRRFQQEIQSGRIAADVLTTSDPAATAALARKGTFVAFKPDNFDKIVAEGRDKDGYYVAQRLNLMTIYARSDKVAAADLPKAWADLTHPKYKGTLVMTDPSFTALQLTVVGMISKNMGWDFYEKLRKNDIMVVQGNQQVSDNVKRGERLIAVGALDSYAADDRKAGHPIVTILPEDGTFVIPSPTAVIKGSPNPNAAKLLAEFMIGDAAQKLFPEDGGYAARIDIAPPADGVPLDRIKVLPVDYDYIEKEAPRLKKRFNEIFQ